MALRYYDPTHGDYRLKRRVLWGLYGFTAGALAGCVAAQLLL